MMTYSVVNLADDRCVFKHKEFDRYYARDRWDSDPHLEMFETDDLSEAYNVWEATKAHWAGINRDAWAIVDNRGEVRHERSN